MADLTVKAGDTFPPLRGRASSESGPMALSSADSIKVIIKHSSGTPIITEDVTVIDPPDTEGFNWKYDWQDGDTDVLGSYSVELEITWDNTTTPPQVQTVPNVGFQTVDVVDDLGGDR